MSPSAVKLFGEYLVTGAHDHRIGATACISKTIAVSINGPMRSAGPSIGIVNQIVAVIVDFIADLNRTD